MPRVIRAYERKWVTFQECAIAPFRFSPSGFSFVPKGVLSPTLRKTGLVAVVSCSGSVRKFKNQAKKICGSETKH